MPIFHYISMRCGHLHIFRTGPFPTSWIRRKGALRLAFLLLLSLLGQSSAQTSLTNTNTASVWDTNNTGWDTAVVDPWSLANGASYSAVFTNTSGSISVAGGGVWLNGITYNAAGNFTITDGTLNFAQTAGSGYFVRSLNADGTLTIGSTLSNVNNNKLVKAGSGELVLNGSGSRLSQVTTTGGTLTLNGGSLTVTNNFFVGEGGDVTVNLAGGTFNNTGGTFIVGWGSGSVSTLNVSGGTNNVVNFQVGRGGNNSTTTVSSGELNVGTFTMGSVANNGATAYTNNFNVNGGAFTVTNAITGIGTVATNSTSIITLNGGTTTFRNGLNITNAKASGATANMVFNGGVLRAESATTNFLNGLNSATLTTNGAVFDPNGVAITVAQALQNAAGQAGKLTLNGSGTLTLSGANTYTGDTTISAGTLALTNGLAIADTGAVSLADVSTAALAVDSSETIGSLRGGGSTGGNVSIASGQTLTVAESGNQTYAGVISSAGSLTKSGNGTLTLSGVNTYSGGTAINAGTLALGGGNNRLSTASTVSIAAGATLDLLTNSQTLVGLTGSGTVTSTTNALSLNVATNVNNTFNGSLNVSAFNKQGDGTLTLSGGSSALDSQFKLKSGQVNMVSGSLTASNGLWIADGTGSVGRLLVSGGTINQTGNAFIVGYGANSSAQMDITGGTLNASLLRLGFGGGSTGTAIQTSGTVNVGTFELGVGVNATNASASYTISGGALTVTNQIINLATKPNSAATLTLSGGTTTFDNGLDNAVMPSGATAVMNFDGGELRPGGSRTNFLQGLTAANLTTNGAVFNPNGYSITVAQVLQNAAGQAGQLTVNGTGTLTLSANNTYTGDTTISAGTLQIAENSNLGATSAAVIISNGGTLRVTSAGTISNAITIGAGNGSLSNASGGTLVFAGTATKDGTVLYSRAGSGTNVFTGVIQGASANSDFVVDGGTTVFSNVMTYNGPTIITNGGTLVLAVDDAMPSGSDLILGGGTFLVDVENYNADSSLSMGTLTLTADSTIDLGGFGTSGDRNLVFADSSGVAIEWNTNAVLTITNWQGVANQQSDVTKLLFGTGGLTTDQLAQIRFADQSIDGGQLLGAQGELAPIPEAPVWMGALAVCSFILWREVRRHRQNKSTRNNGPAALVKRLFPAGGRNSNPL
jgi:fibronectin-binding autotransporter adhesin